MQFNSILSKVIMHMKDIYWPTLRRPWIDIHNLWSHSQGPETSGEKTPFEIIKIRYDSNANKSLKKINVIAKLQSVFLLLWLVLISSTCQVSMVWCNNAEIFVCFGVCSTFCALNRNNSEDILAGFHFFKGLLGVNIWFSVWGWNWVWIRG